MPFRRRRTRLLRGKSFETHADSFLANVGSGSTVGKFIITETEVGARSTTGSPQSVQSFRSTDETCNVGDFIKYINVKIQCAPRDVTPANDRNGWIEWAIVGKREADADIPNTQIGNLTVATIAKQMYKNECIFTGSFPMGATQANQETIQVRIPKPKVMLKTGDTFVLFTYFRSSNSANVATNTMRLINSYMYKCYH